MVDLQGRYSGCQVMGMVGWGKPASKLSIWGYREKWTRERHARGDAEGGEETPRPSRLASLAQIEEFDCRLQWGQKSAAKTSLPVLYSQNCTAGIRRHHHRLF